MQLKTDGTTSALSVGGGQTTLLDTPDPGDYALKVNLANLAVGDEVIVRVFDKTLTGDSYGVTEVMTFSTPPSRVIQTLPRIAALYGAKFTIEQTVGTGRTFKWSVVQHDAPTLATAAAVATLQTTANTIAGYLDTEIASIIATLSTIAGYLDTEIAAILAAVDTEVASILANTNTAATSLSTLQTTANTIAGYIDTEVAAIKAKTDLIPAAPAAVGDIPTAIQNANALLDVANGIESGMTPRQALRGISAVLLGKLSGVGTGTETFRAAVSDLKARVIGTIDSANNRTAVSTDLTP